MKLPSWPNFTGPQEIDLKLDRMFKLLEKLDNPHLKIKNVIHVAGTNGKGSTIAFLRAMLEAKGFSVNVYTSPHLVNFNERIRIKGKLISDVYLQELSDRCNKLCASNSDLRPTFFEGTTALAMLAFAENKADYTIFEVGMGGRLDATNVFKDKLLSIITPIALDHQEFLGDTIAKVAGEKAAIIQGGEKLVVGEQTEEAEGVIRAYAKLKQVEGVYYSDFVTKIKLPKYLGLDGVHQKSNYSLAAKAYQLLMDEEAPQDIKVLWPGRLQYIGKHQSKDIWLDGGHNEHAAEVVSRWLKDNKIESVIIAMNKSKNLDSYLKHLADLEIEIVFCEMQDFADCYRATSVLGKLVAYKNFQEALQSVKGKSVLICGSLFIVGEVLDRLGIEVN